MIYGGEVMAHNWKKKVRKIYALFCFMKINFIFTIFLLYLCGYKD